MYQNKILELLRKLVAEESITGTAKEQGVEQFLDNWLHKLPYFQQHPEQAGLATIPKDPFDRKVAFALVKGQTNKTVVLINHHDVVDISCYGQYQSIACDMEKITAVLQNMELDDEAHADFASGEWVGGRGSNDMKGGMAAQLCFLEEYAQKPDKGSLLFVSVPDEESFSWGMRHGITFLKELKEKYDLEYRLCINSEPNRREEGVQIVPTGSVGKLLPFVLLQGKSTHLSAYEQGLNPLGLLAGLVAATEGCQELQEEYKGERTVPPVWLHMRDCKQQYDFSLPDRAVGYCSLQTFRKSPLDILKIFQDKLAQVIANFRRLHPVTPELPIISSTELLKRAGTLSGFQQWNEQALAQLKAAIYTEGMSYPDATLKYLLQLLDFMDYKEPIAILGFAPPYYPATNSLLMDKPYFEGIQQVLSQLLPVAYEPYFLGVSDCSYCGLTTQDKPEDYSDNTPLWGDLYSFDLKALGQLQIPFMLLGPWGKNLHEITERVNVKSLTEELPTALQAVTEAAWN